MKRLTWKRLNYLLEILPESGNVLWKNPPGLRGSFLVGKPAGCFRHKLKYVHICLDRKIYKRHRLIWFFVHKRWPINDIDHINGNKQDDRLCNLREATRSQNMFNSKLKRNNSSGRKGIVWDKRRLKWRVRMVVKQNEIYVGRFDSFNEALAARVIAEQKHHGEYARAE